MLAKFELVRPLEGLEEYRRSDETAEGRAFHAEESMIIGC